MRENLISITTRMKPEAKKELTRQAKKLGLNFSELVRMILSQWLSAKRS